MKLLEAQSTVLLGSQVRLSVRTRERCARSITGARDSFPFPKREVKKFDIKSVGNPKVHSTLAVFEVVGFQSEELVFRG